MPAAIMAAGAILLGHALQLTNGFYDPTALAGLLVAILCCAVAGVLGAFGDPASNTTLKTLLDDKNLKLATAAVNACVAMKQKPLLEALMEQQRDCEKTMKASANSSFKGGKKPTSARKDPNAPADPEEVKTERAAMLVTLIPGAVQSLTGQEFKSGAEMEAWWSKNKSSFTFPEK